MASVGDKVAAEGCKCSVSNKQCHRAYKHCYRCGSGNSSSRELLLKQNLKREGNIKFLKEFRNSLMLRKWKWALVIGKNILQGLRH